MQNGSHQHEPSAEVSSVQRPLHDLPGDTVGRVVAAAVVVVVAAAVVVVALVVVLVGSRQTWAVALQASA
jgi:hypothetical protein